MAAKWGFCPWCAVSWARWYSWIWIFVPIVIRFVTICFIWHMIGELSAMCGMPFMALWPQQVWVFLLCPVIGLGIAFPCRCWRRTLYEALRCPRSWCFNSTGSMVPRYGSENFLGFYIEKYLMVLHKVQVTWLKTLVVICFWMRWSDRQRSLLNLACSEGWLH